MRELSRLLAHRDLSVTLDIAALELATIEFPGLDPLPSLAILDSYSNELAEMVNGDAPGNEWVDAANSLLFHNVGFKGDEDDYHSPRNSCLNETLIHRRGLPITLAVVYLEIARRHRRPVTGIGLPGHFLVRYEDASLNTYIDCFHGRTLDFEQCRDLALQVARVDVFAAPHLLAPVDNWQILVRMLNNLRNSYYQTRQFEKAVRVLDLLLLARPDAPEEHKQRGVLNMLLKRTRAALTDLERYVTLAPAAEDRAQIEEQAAALRRRLSSLN